MSRFLTTYVDAIVHPRRAFESLRDDPRGLRLGAYAVALTAANYTLVYLFLAHNGGRPTVFTPWLAIPAEVYYRYNVVLHAPSLALAWVSGSAFAHLAARGLGGRGSFEVTLALLGLAASVSTWWTGLHDVVTTFLGYIHVLDQRAYEDAMNSPTPARALLLTLMTFYAVWFFALFTRAIRVAHGLGAVRAAAAGATGVVVYHLVFLVFNR